MANQRIPLTDTPQNLKVLASLAVGARVWVQFRNAPIFHYEEAATAPTDTSKAIRIGRGENIGVRVGAEGIWVWSDGTPGAVAIVAPGV